MKKSKIRSQFEVRLEHSFRRMWLTALVAALVTVVPVVHFEDWAPWGLGVAVFAGLLLGIVIEIRAEIRQRQRARLLSMALEQQTLEADSNFSMVLAAPGPGYSRDEQFREAKINGPDSMRRQPAFAG